MHTYIKCMSRRRQIHTKETHSTYQTTVYRRSASEGGVEPTFEHGFCTLQWRHQNYGPRPECPSLMNFFFDAASQIGCRPNNQLFRISAPEFPFAPVLSLEYSCGNHHEIG
jgi:hypothetical protein